MKAARKTKGSIELLNRAQKRAAETPGDEHRESPARTGHTASSVAATAVAATVATVLNPAVAVLVASVAAPAAAKAASGGIPWTPGSGFKEILKAAKARSPSRARTPDRQDLIIPALPDGWRAQDLENSHSLALRPHNSAGDMLDPLRTLSWEKNMQEYLTI